MIKRHQYEDALRGGCVSLWTRDEWSNYHVDIISGMPPCGRSWEWREWVMGYSARHGMKFSSIRRGNATQRGGESSPKLDTNWLLAMDPNMNIWLWYLHPVSSQDLEIVAIGLENMMSSCTRHLLHRPIGLCGKLSHNRHLAIKGKSLQLFVV